VRRWVVALAALAVACSESEPEIVDGDQIVVAASPAVMERVGTRLRRALEPTPFALPDARAFELTEVDPTTEAWTEARRAAQVLLIGGPEDPWILDALERRNVELPPVPSDTELANVWAPRQHVLVLLLDPDNTRAPTERQLSDLRGLYDRRYRGYVVERMYFPEGPYNALADTLEERGGFELLVPVGSAWSVTDEVYLFEPPVDSSGIERHLMVTWQSPIPEGLQSDARALLGWRERVAAEHYAAPQSVDPTQVRGGPTTQRGSRAIQLLGSWRAQGVRGPFLMRGVVCPVQDRMYLIDGWMTAPEQGGQEQMVEIESILNSFRCGTAEG
jgi:hypothetical protein